jgi:hypothetical protein
MEAATIVAIISRKRARTRKQEQQTKGSLPESSVERFSSGCVET